MAIAVRFLLFAIIVYCAYRILKPSYPVTLTLNSQGIVKCKGLSKQSRQMIDDFAREFLLAGETMKVSGYYVEHGRLRWVFAKNINPSLAQRFRNLMINESEFKR